MCTQARLCVRRLVHAYAWSCPETLSLVFLILFLISMHKFVSIFTLLCMYDSLFHCLIVRLHSHVKIRVYLLFICFKYHEHAFTCSYIDAIGIVMWRGKSRIHMYMHFVCNIILFRFDEHDMIDRINIFVILMLWMMNMICLLHMFLPWIWYDDMMLDEC